MTDPIEALPSSYHDPRLGSTSVAGSRPHQVSACRNRRCGFGNDLGKGLRNSVGAIANGEIGEKAFGDVLAIRVVSSVGGYELALGVLGGKPFGGVCVGGVEGGVRYLVDEGFLEDLVCRILLGLPRMNQQVVVTPAEEVVPLLELGGLHVFLQALGQASDDGRVL